jgi:hypothetical protein
MSILDAEYQFDHHKLVYFFEADRYQQCVCVQGMGGRGESLGVCVCVCVGGRVERESVCARERER